jgi:two-component system, OmpR family, KDP operon response regulator KdpE
VLVRILVVGRDPELGRALAICLHAKGHHVDVVATAPGSPELAGGQPDVVLVDLSHRLPDERASGADLIKALRSESRVPVIALSDRWKGRRAEARSTGADAWLEKPFGVDQLLACVHDALRVDVGAFAPTSQ